MKRARVRGAWLACLLCAFLAGCGPAGEPHPSSTAPLPAAPPSGLLPSLGGRALTAVVSPAAQGAGEAWLADAAALLNFRAIQARPGGWVDERWAEVLRGREAELAVVLATEVEAAEREFGFERGEESPAGAGPAVVALYRPGAKWRTALNAAVKWRREVPR